MLRLALRYGAIALLIVACSAGKPGPGPNAGHVLFGTSYDPATFTLSGPTSRAPQGHDIAFAASFTKRVDSGQIHLLAVINGHTVLDQAVTVTNGPWSIYGGTIPGTRLFEPGPMIVRVVDDTDVLLSTGTLTVTAPASSSPGGSSPSPT